MQLAAQSRIDGRTKISSSFFQAQTRCLEKWRKTEEKTKRKENTTFEKISTYEVLDAEMQKRKRRLTLREEISAQAQCKSNANDE